MHRLNIRTNLIFKLPCTTQATPICLNAGLPVAMILTEGYLYLATLLMLFAISAQVSQAMALGWRIRRR